MWTHPGLVSSTKLKPRLSTGSPQRPQSTSKTFTLSPQGPQGAFRNFPEQEEDNFFWRIAQELHMGNHYSKKKT
jgi:hypothetical protein